MLEHTKRQVDMIKTNLFITAACILFLIHAIMCFVYRKLFYRFWDPSVLERNPHFGRLGVQRDP